MMDQAPRKNKYELVILVDAGIGNTLEALYALEYCLRKEVDAGIFIGDKVPSSFRDHLQSCYGSAVITELSDVKTRHLIHGFTYQEELLPEHENYLYISADYHSTRHKSETEQFLEVVRALYPGGKVSRTLTQISGKATERVKQLNIENKYVLYPGGSASNSARRWPHYPELLKALGEDHCMIVGGKPDLDYSASYVYPPFIASVLPQKILNSRKVFGILKNLKLLTPHAHWVKAGQAKNAFFNALDWGELVYLFGNCKAFVGNDGGLTHLAASVGAKGVVLFGPTSVNKNKPYNDDIRPLFRNLPCSPCQFGVGGINMTQGYITCPFQVKCLRSITTKEVISSLNERI